MVRAVIFDLDNTLYSYDGAHPAAYAAVADYARRRLGLEDFDALHREASRLQLAHAGGVSAAVHNRLIRYQLLLESRGLPLVHAPVMARLYWDTFLEGIRPFPGARDTLARLKAGGLTVGIGTNMTAERQFVKLERLGLLPYFDFLVSSEEAGAEKPDARLFRLCVEMAGCAADECLFVGDSLEGDVHGARAAGLQALWFCPGAEEPGEGRLRSLDELPEALRRL